MKTGLVASALIILLLSGASYSTAEVGNSPGKTVPVALKMGYLIPSGHNFTPAALIGVTLQTDMGPSFIGALDFDVSPASDCKYNVPGVQTRYCKARHRIFSVSVKKKMRLGKSNKNTLLGAGLVYVTSNVNLAEDFRRTVNFYDSSANRLGIVVSMEVEEIGLFPGSFLQVRYFHTGSSSSSTARAINKLSGFTLSLGGRIKY